MSHKINNTVVISTLVAVIGLFSYSFAQEIDDELVEKLKKAIAEVQAEFVDCQKAREEAIKKDSEARMGSGAGVPPKPWAGFARKMDTGIYIPDCSDVNKELRRLEEELARALRGESITTPGEEDNSELSTDVENAEEQANSERDKARQLSCQMSVFSQDAAIVLGVGAGICGVAAIVTSPTVVGGVGLAGAAGVLAIGSGAAAWVGNKYSKLCNHPPRYDFKKVSKFKLFDFKLDPPRSDFEANWQDFSKQTIYLSIAMRMFTESLERYEAVRELRRKYQSVGFLISPTLLKERIDYEIIQTEAVQHNAASCIQIVDSLLALKPKVNSAWQELKRDLRAANIPEASLNPVKLKNKFAETWQANMLSFQRGFRLSGLEMEEVMQAVNESIQKNKLSSELPDVLFHESWNESMQKLSVQLYNVSTAYGKLNKALQDTWGSGK